VFWLQNFGSVKEEDPFIKEEGVDFEAATSGAAMTENVQVCMVPAYSDCLGKSGR